MGTPEGLFEPGLPVDEREHTDAHQPLPTARGVRARKSGGQPFSNFARKFVAPGANY
jgi:hypothetical protein